MILEHQVHLFPPPEPLMMLLFEWCTEPCAVVQSSEFIRAKTTANQLDWPYKPCLASSKSCAVKTRGSQALGFMCVESGLRLSGGCPVSPLTQLCPLSSAPFSIVKGLYLGQVSSQVSAVVCLWVKFVGQGVAITRAQGHIRLSGIRAALRAIASRPPGHSFTHHQIISNRGGRYGEVGKLNCMYYRVSIERDVKIKQCRGEGTCDMGGNLPCADGRW